MLASERPAVQDKTCEEFVLRANRELSRQTAAVDRLRRPLSGSVGRRVERNVNSEYPSDQPQLSGYQRHLLERLQPLLDRLDQERVTKSSGLRIQTAGNKWTLEVTVEARSEPFPGLYLFATQEQCILSFADSEILECHRDPGSAEDLVDEVIALTERYLSGATILEHYNRKGNVVRTDYFYDMDSEADPRRKIGTGGRLFTFPRKVVRTVKRSFRFLREEGHA